MKLIDILSRLDEIFEKIKNKNIAVVHSTSFDAILSNIILEYIFKIFEVNEFAMIPFYSSSELLLERKFNFILFVDVPQKLINLHFEDVLNKKEALILTSAAIKQSYNNVISTASIKPEVNISYILYKYLISKDPEFKDREWLVYSALSYNYYFEILKQELATENIEKLLEFSKFALPYYLYLFFAKQLSKDTILIYKLAFKYNDKDFILKNINIKNIYNSFTKILEKEIESYKSECKIVAKKYKIYYTKYLPYYLSKLLLETDNEKENFVYVFVDKKNRLEIRSIRPAHEIFFLSDLLDGEVYNIHLSRAFIPSIKPQELFQLLTQESLDKYL